MIVVLHSDLRKGRDVDFKFIALCIAIATLKTALVVGFIYYRRSQRVQREPHNQIKEKVPTRRDDIAATLALLEGLKGRDEGMRIAMVREIVNQIIQEGYLPGITLEHADPKKFEELIGFVRSRAHPETL